MHVSALPPFGAECVILRRQESGMSGNKEPPTLIPFGPFEADLSSQELRKQGVRLRLPRQSFQILKMLLERPGKLVTREELRQTLWPADTFVDFQHSLNAAINRLRETLGDNADNPRYIETLPRRGYRFIYATAPHGVTAPEAAAASDVPAARQFNPPVQDEAQPSRRVWPLVGAAVPLLVVILFAFNTWGLRSKLFSQSAAQPQIRSLAVLPLRNMSGDPDQEFFADEMTEELIAELSRVASLKVISHTSVMQYKGENKKPLPQIGRELNVDAVMEGSVARSGNRVRIVAQLIYAPTDQHLWVETYDRDLGDVLKLQREVAEAVAEKVRAKLTPEQQARFRQTKQVDPDAFGLYMNAMALHWALLDENKKAQSKLESVIEKDPGFAEAYVALAGTHIYLGQFRWLPPRDAYPPAEQILRKALKLDDKNCRAHDALAYLAYRYDWEWADADKEYRYALELCPNSAEILGNFALFAAVTGRADEAQAELAKARELNILCPCLLQYEALRNYHLRNYRAMIEPSRQQVQTSPDLWVPHYLLGVGYEGSGQTRKAIPEYQRAVEVSRGDSDPLASLAHAYATTGKRSEAEKILHEWLRREETSYLSPYMIATVYASLGHKDDAFEYLEKAYQERSSDLPYFLKADLRMDSLRSDPRFQDLMRRMNFPR